MKEKDEAKANSIGFDKCEWEVEEDDECERCGSKGVQLYFGNRDPLCSSDGDYWCIDCISKHIADNDAWVKECEEKWVDGGEAMAGALAGM